MSKLEKEVRFLKLYAFVMTLLFGVVALAAFKQAGQKMKFTELDVERLNIVEADGRLRLVIANAERQHPGVIDGQTLTRKRPAGLLFFNEKGDECGGLAFGGNQKDGKSEAGALLAFDRFRQDQTVGLQYDEGSNGQYSAGLRVWDRPDASLGPVVEKLVAIGKMSDGPQKEAALKELQSLPGAGGAQRVAVGRDRNNNAAITLADAKGKPRLKLSVDAAGASKLEFMDEAGKVTYSLPPAK